MDYRPLFPAWLTDKDLDTILKSLISSKYSINEDIEIDINKDKVLSLIGIKSISDFDIIAKNQESASNFDWYINKVLEELVAVPLIAKYKEIIQNPKEIQNFIEQFEDIEELAEDEDMSVDEYIQSKSAKHFVQSYLSVNEFNGNLSVNIENISDYDEIYQEIRDILVEVRDKYIDYICDTILEYAESLGIETDFTESRSIVSTISKYMQFTLDDWEDTELEIRFSDHDNGQISANLNLWYQDGMKYNIDKAKQKLLEFKKLAQ